MKTITLEIKNEDIFDKIFYFLNNLPKKDINIITQKEKELLLEENEEKELINILKNEQFTSHNDFKKKFNL